ncbi:sigma-54-dependent transcriptional regulator [Persicirhabdus sediminis]|uniref:Sigma-54-dependent Fis family transcriptional regulator n=1 Tax=Persicirhabdus sediminis TaxID=454144 RepID=A0A8J7MDV3_9BACT|nr:sigma-54 dependent transcriptional regulator [Persicirhabdus sediminis]MBK1791172.1 sigma-54-dependent Fis family transcriptional regulator [Persicirhabdus sediminis]
MQSTLLIVDDEKATRDGLRIALEDEFDCYVAGSPAEAVRILKSQQVDVMLTDLRMGSDSGMDLLEEAKKVKSPPVSIMMTAYGSVDTAVEAMRRGAWHFVTKPLNIDEVEMLVKRAVNTHQLKQSNVQLEKENVKLKKQVTSQQNKLPLLVGNSPAMHRVGELIKQIAPSKATVLIEGESGTGKELVAQAIHQLSDRPKDKLVTVNCAALSPQLLESELFGHEKGAFTGAAQRRIGRFEQADGGTLFLDEIGEIDATTQVKLLRALSERKIERVGSNSPIQVDVRVITATNRHLAKMVEDGDFREDLFFRLNVVQLDLPPLRDREDDILLLANVFLKEFAEENGKNFKPLSGEAVQLLNQYGWPGNVRELRTSIEHGVIMARDNDIEIGIDHLPLRIADSAASYEPASAEPNFTKSTHANTEPVKEFNLHNLEIRTIKGALKAASNNRTEAAKLLGISRRTLQRKIKEFKLS